MSASKISFTKISIWDNETRTFGYFYKAASHFTVVWQQKRWDGWTLHREGRDRSHSYKSGGTVLSQANWFERITVRLPGRSATQTLEATLTVVWRQRVGCSRRPRRSGHRIQQKKRSSRFLN